jgi:hypothetical protein
MGRRATSNLAGSSTGATCARSRENKSLADRAYKAVKIAVHDKEKK